jgi:hypothetical protein
LNELPLIAIFILAVVITLGSIEVGWRIGNYQRRHHASDDKASIGAAVGATLGLLAFLLAFTFGMAASRFDTRKQNVLHEANAIGTTYLRADFLPTPARDQVRSLLREYTVHRSGGMAAIFTPQGMQKSVALLDQLWTVSVNADIDPDSDTVALYFESLNQMIDFDATRLTGLRNQIPVTIWWMLAIVTIFSMASMGYEFGLTGTRNWAVTILLVIVFTVVLTLIVDLDRPQSGLIHVSQQPLIDLLNTIGQPAP